MSNITNLNRDYLIKINVKEATIDVPKMTFWNTDKKTSNMFVQLVINMSTNELISQYVTVQNATDYKITLNVIKPKTKQYKTIEATLLNEEKALFEIDLPDEFTDQVGDYSFEFEVSSKVDSNDESITTSNGIYKVNGSILTNLNEETSSSPDLPILKQLIEQVKSLQGGDLTGYQKKEDETLETTSKKVVGAINEVNSQFKDIANNFTTEQTTNSYKIKYGTKIIAEIPLSSTTPLVTYTITNKLTNATSSNDTNSITKGSSYTATITPSDGYIIDVITVTMDGNDVTSNVVHENAITINNVIGNIVITATASQHPTTNPLTNLIADIQPTDYYLDKTDSLYKISDRINNVTIIVYTLQPGLNPLKTFPGGDFANNLTKIGTTFQGNTGGVSFIYEQPNSSAGEITNSQKLNNMVRFLNEFKNNTWNNYTSQANGIPYINTSGTSTTYNSESYYKTHENIKSTTGEWDRCIMTISLESNGEIKTYLNDELSNTIPAPADFKNWDYVAMSDTWNKLELIGHKVNTLVDNNYQITCIIRKGATSIKDIQNYYKYKTSQSLSLESNVSALNLEEGDNFFSNLA